MTDHIAPDASPEPSMEEILASIRQIISEDLASAAAKPHSEAAGDDVLVLRERAPREPSPFAPPREEPAEGRSETPPHPSSPAAASPVEPEAGEPPASAPEAAASQPAEPAAVESQAGAARSLTVASALEPAVVSPKTAAVVATSFERLAFVVENTPPPPPFAISAGGATLEDITRDILTPVIKAWLDENLPAIVQARVDEEVERITRSRVR